MTASFLHLFLCCFSRSAAYEMGAMSGIYDAAKAHAADSKVYGFLNGPHGAPDLYAGCIARSL